jgi:site-specific DNA-methyltransferase (adenine-specific)
MIKINNDFKNLIPPLSMEEYKQLEENLITDGIREPIVLWKDTIIDGHNRYEIAIKNHIEIKTVEMNFKDEDEAKIWIIRNQFGRRNLTPYVRSELALELKPLISKQAKENQQLADGGDRKSISYINQGLEKSPKVENTIDTRKEIATMAGVSDNTISKVEHIKNDGIAELKEKVKTNEISINQAEKISKLEPEKQKAVIEKMEKSNAGAEAIIKSIQKEERKQEMQEAKHSTPVDNLEGFIFYNEDITDGLHNINDDSVDIIITDPPYPKEYLPLYENLAETASRVLKDGGLAIVMVGQSYLPDIIQLMSKHLTYHWMCSYLTPGGQATQLWQRKVNTFWKPLLVFSKGEYNGDWFGDVCKSEVNDNDKRFHEWGQSISGMNDIVNRFTYPQQIVLDPFMGAGTTGVSCALLNRKFVGNDISLDCIQTAKTRIEEVIHIARS